MSETTFKQSPARRAQINKSLKKHRARQKVRDVELELAPPVAESTARRRKCRVCFEPCEAKSYWYCPTHNVLSSLDDANVLYSAHDINVESF